jgi:hypothetical protein
MNRFYQHLSIVFLIIFILVTRVHAQNPLLPGTVLEGFAIDKSNKNYPMVVNIVSMDYGTGSFTGEVSWPSLNSVHRIEGRLASNTITFKEVSQVKKGGARLNCEYAMVIDGKSLDGRWVDPGRDRGIVQLKIK